MRNPYKLRVTETAFSVADLTYRATAQFPSTERFGLVAQMRRAAVSIGSNIAEGCGRCTDAQLVNFLQYSSGSASELEFQARLAMRLRMGRPPQLTELCELVRAERMMLAGLTRRLDPDY
ncbi:MAG: four helix bundle protein [bacterium]